jgi:ethanolamine utilization protein EutJ
MAQDLTATMAALDAALHAGPLAAPPTAVKAGVDLGTAYTVLVALDEHDRPLAAAYEFADVVRDGVVTDFVGAVDVLRRLTTDVEARLGVAIPGAFGAFPPGVPRSEVRAVAHVIEAAGMDCDGLIDEPTAANAVLGLRDGVVVDVGGGTTGVAVLQEGEVVHTDDQPTGGTHFTLVIAGALGLPIEQAEQLKLDPAEQARLFPLVRPVMEKVASIVARSTRGWPTPEVHLVGGPVAFPGFADVVAEATGMSVTVPVAPLFVTPLGIARSATTHPTTAMPHPTTHPRASAR